MRMRVIFFTLILFISAFDLQAQVSPKRKAPKEVAPVVFQNVKYTAPINQMGWVVARDMATDTVIRKKKIYTIRYNHGLEEDVQDVFIDSLYIENKMLMIHTERGKIYFLNLLH